MSFPAATYMPPARPAAHPAASRAAVLPSTSPARGAYGAPGGAAAQAARYREAELLSATPGQLVVMLFDKMLLTLRRARLAMDAGDIEQRTVQLLAADDMIAELKVSLDHEQGGAISRDLDALYAFMLRELHAANRTKDGARIDVVLRIAAELREAFAGAQRQLAASAAPAARTA
jgi:flagellar protein FliS